MSDEYHQGTVFVAVVGVEDEKGGREEEESESRRGAEWGSERERLTSDPWPMNTHYH